MTQPPDRPVRVGVIIASTEKADSDQPSRDSSPDRSTTPTLSISISLTSPREEWFAKPIAFVSYGGLAGGLRAVEHLRLVFTELHAVTIREAVSFHNAHGSFDAEGQPIDKSGSQEAAAKMLRRLCWWAKALLLARTREPYPA